MVRLLVLEEEEAMILARVWQSDDPDGGLYAVYMVHHPEKPDTSFQGSWNMALRKAKKAQGEEWNVGDVKELLEKWGWVFCLPPSVSVSF